MRTLFLPLMTASCPCLRFHAVRLPVLLCIMLFFIACAPLNGAAEEKPLPRSIVAGAIITPPWIMGTEEARTTGYCIAVFTEAFRRVQTRLITLPMTKPRLQSSLAKGKIHAVLCSSRSWHPNLTLPMAESLPVGQSGNIILMRRSSAGPVRSPQDLAGRTMAARLGYFFPAEYEEAFKRRTIRRVDVTSGLSGLHMLLAGRVDAVIMEENEAEWLLWQEKQEHAVVIVYRFSALTPLALLLSGPEQRLMPAVNNALRHMQQDGTIQALRTRYLQKHLESID